VSGFDRRWQRLVESARTTAPETTKAVELRADELAEVGLASALLHQRAAREGRGFALAGLLYIGCLCGAGGLSDALGWTPDVRSAARELARAHRHLPNPSLVASPEGVPALQDLAPARVLGALERWWLVDDRTEEPR
jgi:hypothetical protein